MKANVGRIVATVLDYIRGQVAKFTVDFGARETSVVKRLEILGVARARPSIWLSFFLQSTASNASLQQYCAS